MSNHNYLLLFFFFNDTATTEIYTLSLHDALPISRARASFEHILKIAPDDYAAHFNLGVLAAIQGKWDEGESHLRRRSEEHTSELQSLAYLVCRLLLEKKKNELIVDLIHVLNDILY